LILSRDGDISDGAHSVVLIFFLLILRRDGLQDFPNFFLSSSSAALPWF